MLPKLKPGTYYIEMDPGVADTAHSGLDEQLASSDIAILSAIWDDWAAERLPQDRPDKAARGLAATSAMSVPTCACTSCTSAAVERGATDRTDRAIAYQLHAPAHRDAHVPGGGQHCRVPAAGAAVPAADILVVDDNSPDGTADIAARTAAELGRIDILRRPKKNGLGEAYRAGFSVGIERGYDILVQIDADLSHDPAAIDAMFSAIDGGADAAV
jgi:cellulose synthase/poly-beta-1,6-N-acetylglucosamine synthase-like glycosyltransferase